MSPTSSNSTVPRSSRAVEPAGASGNAGLAGAPHCCLSLPQHDMVVLLVRVFEVEGRRDAGPGGGETFEQDRGSREGRPEEEAFAPPCAEDRGERSGDPDAQAVETVEQVAPEPGPRVAAEPGEEVPRSILGAQQVGEAPGGEAADQKFVQTHAPCLQARAEKGRACRPAAADPGGRRSDGDHEAQLAQVLVRIAAIAADDRPL